MTIEPNKFYKTRSGLKARIYAVDGVGGATIHGAVLQENGWNHWTWYRGGTFYNGATNNFDLVDTWTEPKPKLKAWIAKDSRCVSFLDREPHFLTDWIRAEWLDQP